MGVSSETTMMLKRASPISVLDLDDEAEEEKMSLSTSSSSARSHSSSGREKRRLDYGPATSLNFRNRLLCDKTVEWLARGDEDCSQLEMLWLGPVFESSKTVLNAIATLPSSVTHLDLDLRNALHILPQVMPVLFSKTHVDTLSVRIFGDGSAIELAKWVHKNPHLKRLDLRGNRIGSKGARAIFEALTRCHHQLVSLNLSCNCVVNGSVIFSFLKTSNIESLDLSYNRIGDTELLQICDALQTNTSLRELNLFGCQRISKTGLDGLLECLKRYNTSLRRVSVQVFESHNTTGVWSQIEVWLANNRAGRCLLQNESKVPRGLWSKVFEKSKHNPDSIYYLLQESPALL